MRRGRRGRRRALGPGGAGQPFYSGNFPRLGHAYCTVQLQDGGVLIYQTFAAGNEAYGRPKNPDFLLRPGELLDAFTPSLSVIAYQHGIIGNPEPAVIQRIAAVKSAAQQEL